MRYDKTVMKEEEENLDEYLKHLDRYIIIEGITEEEYDAAFSRIEKLIKLLKKGKGDKVYNEERYIKYRLRDSLRMRGIEIPDRAIHDRGLMDRIELYSSDNDPNTFRELLERRKK